MLPGGRRAPGRLVLAALSAGLIIVFLTMSGKEASADNPLPIQRYELAPKRTATPSAEGRTPDQLGSISLKESIKESVADTKRERSAPKQAAQETLTPEPTFTPGPGASDRLELNINQTSELDCNTLTLTVSISGRPKRQDDPFPEDANVRVKAPEHMTFADGSDEKTFDLDEGQTLVVTLYLVPGPYNATAALVVKSNYSHAYTYNLHLRDCSTVAQPTATPTATGVVGSATVVTQPSATPTATGVVSGETVVPQPSATPTATRLTSGTAAPSTTPSVTPTGVAGSTAVPGTATPTPTATRPSTSATAAPTNTPPPGQPTVVLPGEATATPTATRRPSGDSSSPTAVPTAVAAGGGGSVETLAPSAQIPSALPQTGGAASPPLIPAALPRTGAVQYPIAVSLVVVGCLLIGMGCVGRRWRGGAHRSRGAE